jgi:hypothetical protein
MASRTCPSRRHAQKVMRGRLPKQQRIPAAIRDTREKGKPEERSNT